MSNHDLQTSWTAIDEMMTNNAGTVDTNYRFKDGVFQIKNVVDGKYHTVWIDAGGFKVATTGEA